MRTLRFAAPVAGTTALPSASDIAAPGRRLPALRLGLALGLFAAISYVLCIALGLVFPDGGLHRPWLQFFPGFVWLTWPSFFLGLAESVIYGLYAGLVFAPLYNLIVARPREAGSRP
jgi:hypothetical protein